MNDRLAVLSLLVLLGIVSRCPGSMIWPTHSDSHHTEDGNLLCQPNNNEDGSTETTTKFLDLKANHHGYERGMNTALLCQGHTTVGAPLKLDDVPLVDVDGVDYRQFVLDIDSPDAKKAAACLDALKIYVACKASLKHARGSGRVGKLAFNLSGHGGQYPLINDDDSGTETSHHEFLIDIPQSDFQRVDESGRDRYIYLYSCLKTFDKSCRGRADWSVEHWCQPPPCPPIPVPEPGSVGALCLALLALRRGRRRSFTFFVASASPHAIHYPAP